MNDDAKLAVILLGPILLFALPLLCIATSCVRNVQVCATYDRSLQRPTFERPERDRVGASVCADVGPPAR